MTGQSNKHGGLQFSIRAILLLTLIVAVFMAGRLSTRGQLERSKAELNRARAELSSAKLILAAQQQQNSLAREIRRMEFGQNFGIRQSFQVPFQVPVGIRRSKSDGEIPDSIEHGMKASELEMKARMRSNERPSPNHF